MLLRCLSLSFAALTIGASSQSTTPQFRVGTSGGLPANASGTGSASGDLNGDGHVDVVTSSAQVFLGDGQGGFRLHIELTPARTFFRAIGLGDIDRDGDLDIVLGIGGVSLWRNDGTAAFVDDTSTSIPNQPADLPPVSQICLADLDADGDLDLVIGRQTFPGESSLSLATNNGSGHFSNQQSIAALSAGTRFDVGDTDRDGDLDIVCTLESQQLAILEHDGRGSFSASIVAADASSSLTLADIHNDGSLDIISIDSFRPARVFDNDGTGAFASGRPLPDGVHGMDAQAIDIDGDGDVDILSSGIDCSYNLGCDPTPASLVRNEGSGIFTRVDLDISVPTDIEVNHFNGDRHPDFIASSSSNTFLYFGLGDGTFAPRYSTIDEPFFQDALDIDRDGDLDILAGGRLFLNDGSGSFERVDVIPRSNAISLGLFVDYDGDGDNDIVLAESSSGTPNGIEFFDNDGQNRFSRPTQARVSTSVRRRLSLRALDVDNDGDLDLLTGSESNPFIGGGGDILLINDGRGFFVDETATRWPTPDPRATSAIGVADFDGDGDVDALCAKDGSQDLLYVNDGRGFFTAYGTERLPEDRGETKTVAVGDTDGDGDLDAVFGEVDFFGASTLRFYRNDGSGHFSESSRVFRAPASHLELADVDEDGDLDLIGAPSLLLNDGHGRFTPELIERAPSRAVRAALDLDRDGDIDLVIGRLFQLEIAFNLLRHIAPRNAALPGQTFLIDATARYGPTRIADLFIPLLGTGPSHVELPPIGVLGVDPASVAFLAPVSARPGETATIALPIPVSGLSGLELYLQSILVQWPAQERLTNTIRFQVW